MSCGTESTTAATGKSPCCVEGKADYFEVARKIAISGAGSLVSQMIEVRDANVIEIDAQDFSPSVTISSVSIQLQYGNDAVNWTLVSPSPAMTFQGPGNKSGVVSAISAKFARLVFRGSGRVTRMSAGMRLRTEPPILIKSDRPLLPGLESPGPGADRDYFLLADRLSVAQASSAYLPPISMADRNAVQLEVTVLQTTAGLAIGADIEGSNDAQTWETLRSYTGLSFGANAPAALTDVSHRYVRVKVVGPQAFGPAEVALGLTLSRQSR